MSEITKLVQTSGSDMNDILEAGGAMLLCALGSLVATFITAGIAAALQLIFQLVYVPDYLTKFNRFQWRKLIISQQQV